MRAGKNISIEFRKCINVFPKPNLSSEELGWFKILGVFVHAMVKEI